MRRIENRRVDAMMRLAGLAAVAAAALAVLALRHRAAGEVAARDPLIYLLALIAFVGGSVGMALVTLGHHLFDRVEVARPWSRLGDARRSATRGQR